MEKLRRELLKSNTNHVLHMIISFFSIGLWVVPWFCISMFNRTKRNKFEMLIDDGRYSLSDIDISIEKIKESSWNSKIISWLQIIAIQTIHYLTKK